MLGKAGRSLLRMTIQGAADDENANEALRKVRRNEQVLNNSSPITQVTSMKTKH
jgi:hypothetical protein